MNTSASSNADLLRELRINRNDPPPQRSLRGLWITLGVLAALAVLALIGMRFFGARATEVQVTEVMAPASGNAAASVLDATGYVVARRMATVSAKITGKIREVRIEEGQRVETGEIMATLDPIDADQQAALAASQVTAARSAISGLEAQVREASANAARLAALSQQQLISRAQYEQAIAQRDALQSQLATARNNAVVSSRNLRIAQQGVDNTIVRAPFAGVVIAKAAQEGEIVSPFSAGGGFTRTGIGTIVDMDSLEVEVDVGEAYIGRVKAGMPVEATLNAYPDWKIPAEVIAIIPTADRGKATVKVRIKLNSNDARIVPEMGVKVSFLEAAKPATEHAQKGVRVESAAITQRDGKDVAFVVAKDIATQRAVTAAAETGGGMRVVTQGLQVGEQVVIDPPDTLKNGARVSIKTDASTE